MDAVAVSNIIAVLLSPLVAVLVTRWMENRREVQRSKQRLFWELYGRRHQIVHVDSVRALNLIDVVFAKDRSVRQLWSQLYDMYGNEGLNNDNGFSQRNAKVKELLVEMAKSCGYKADINHLDAERIYIPQGLIEDSARSAEVHNALVDLFKNDGLKKVVSGESESAEVIVKAKQNELSANANRSDNRVKTKE